MTTAGPISDLPRDARRTRTSDLLAQLPEAEGRTRDQVLEEVILANTGVARSIARRYARRGIPTEDLEQVAYLALIRAAQKFDGDRAEDFLVYAVPTIRGEIRRWFRDHGWMVRPPRSLQELQSAVLRARASADRELSAAELATLLEVPEANVNEALRVRGCFTPTSLDAPAAGVREDSDTTLGDLLLGESDDIDACETRIALEQAMAALTPRERLVVRLRYREDMTQAEIGEIIGVTQMQVSRILSKARDILRERLRDSGVAA
jgi:RNA polymerase sigma-B factor